LVVVVGPTGAGKSDVALRIAQTWGGEILSADSQQVYRGMDIGTAKTGPKQQREVRHHLLDVLDPSKEMTAGHFVSLADQAISQIQARQHCVVVAGGTMLYVQALLRGLFNGPPADPLLRQELEKEAQEQGLVSLWQKLAQVDPQSSTTIHKTDARRIIRALEVFQKTGLPLSEHHKRHKAQPDRHNALIICVQPEREQLYQRINARVLQMIDAGLVQEVQQLRDQGYPASLRSQQAIGYREIHDHLDQKSTLEEAIALIQRNSRRYARRQMSWYRGQENLHRFPSPSEVDLSALERYLLPA